MRATIGPGGSNDIVVRHGSVSRTHAVITRDVENGRYVIVDLRSTNAVRVNGKQYGKVQLRAGDYVDLG
jgi:pSer/pThr/pTyr-binding forkhead associated (FHA) protein